MQQAVNQIGVDQTSELVELADPQDYLTPERYPIGDLFICDVQDAVLKDVIETLEHPFYALSKRPETQIREYRNGDNWLRVIPSVVGLATIYDKDILLYCISQLMVKKNRGERLAKRVRINTRDLLQFTNRGTAGKDYQAISDAVDRLAGTRIATNIRRGEFDVKRNFGLIEDGTVVRKNGLDGRLLWLDITLSDWIFEAVKSSNVLTLHRDYFRLRKPLERRLYELARKECGHQSHVSRKVETLHLKSGSKSNLRHFRYMVRAVVENDHLPDYQLEYDEQKDQVLIINRQTMPMCESKTDLRADEILRRLSPDIRERARPLVPGWDLNHVERVFANWWDNIGRPVPRSSDAMFLKFCRSFYERNGRP